MYSFSSVIHRLVRQLIIKAIINKGLNYIDQTARATLKLHARNVDYTSVKIMHTYIPQKDTEYRMDGNNFIIPCQTKVLRFVFIHPDFITLFPCSDCMLKKKKSKVQQTIAKLSHNVIFSLAMAKKQ